jgi:hypothetical protein
MIEESMKFWEDEVSRRSGKKMKSPVLLKEKELNGLHLKFPDPESPPVKIRKKNSNLKTFKEIELSKKKESKNKKIF